MLTNSKIALSVALVLATASAAVAAPKHAVRHQTATEALRPAEGAGANGDACRHPPQNRPLHGIWLETRPGCTPRLWHSRYDASVW